MDIYYILAYITGGLIILIFLLTFVFPRRRLTLILKASGDFVCFLNNLFIYLATKNPAVIAGIATNLIATVRDILFSFRSKSKVLDNIAWPIAFAATNAASLIFTYRSPISILPVVGSVISTLTLFSIDQRILKTGALIDSIIYSVYYAILLKGSDILTIFSLVSTLAGVVSSIVGLIILFVKLKKQKDINLQQ